MRRSGRRCAVLAGAFSIAQLVAGCGQTPIPLPDGAVRGQPITYAGASLPHAGVVDGAWESSPWSGAGVVWLPFPGLTDVRLLHTLGRTPSTVDAYLAFDPSGARAGRAAGDLARVVTVSSTEVVIQNGTAQDYYVRVVLR